jgi:hypothetical protein
MLYETFPLLYDQEGSYTVRIKCLLHLVLSHQTKDLEDFCSGNRATVIALYLLDKVTSLQSPLWRYVKGQHITIDTLDSMLPFLSSANSPVGAAA